MIFVDTNVFLRFLLKDQEEQHMEAKKLFIDASNNKIKLMTSVIVIFETYWVLSSFYQRSKQEVARVLTKLLTLNFKLREKELLLESLDYFKSTNLSLEDSYNLKFAKSQKVNGFKTFDIQLSKHFSKG